MTTLTPRTETILGANCTGSDGDLNRTYVLANSDAISQMFTITRSGGALAQSTDFTLANDTVTFLLNIFDTDNIVLNYFTTDAVTITTAGLGYCSTSDVYRTAGITSTEISTADVSQYILEAESYICKITNNVYWKRNEDAISVASATNNTVTFSGVTWTTNELAGEYVWIYMGTGINQIRKIVSNTATELTADSNWDTNPVAGDLGRVFYTPDEINPKKDEPIDGNNMRTFILPYYPVNLLESLDIYGTTVTPSNVYVYPKTGKLTLKSTAEASRFTTEQPQAITPVYWYGLDHLPLHVKRLVELRAAINILQQQMGGTFDDPSMVTLPEAGITVGQAYINIAGTLERLRAEYDEILNRGKVFPVFG